MAATMAIAIDITSLGWTIRMFQPRRCARAMSTDRNFPFKKERRF
jgi:hypothetical protein